MKNSFLFFIFMTAATLFIFCSPKFSDANPQIPNTNPLATEENKVMFKCGSEEAWKRLRQTDTAGFDYRKKVYEDGIREYLQKNPYPETQAAITIPVVFHVLWRTDEENLSDGCIKSCIDALNRDFRKLNTDISTAPAQFQAIAADCGFNFCLATKDPKGNPTTGIIRKKINASFTTDEKIKFSANGGDDTWGKTNYLNIWTVNLGVLGGYSYSGCVAAADVDGVVLNYQFVGQDDCGMPGYRKGRSSVHEVGHWLGMYEIFQDGCAGTSPSDCDTKGDKVCDTPPAANSNGMKPDCNQQNTCTETPNDQINMIQNYMDYSGANCRVMFTNGQKARMIATYNQCRQSVGNNASTYCSTAALDVGISNVILPIGIVCNTTFTPIVKLSNFGMTTLTSCTINYKIDGGSDQTFNWTGTLASMQSTNVTLSSITTTSGTHTFTSSSGNPNGSTDGDAKNDQSSSTFSIMSAQSLPLTEGLENTTFPPTGWTLNNPDAGSITWARTTTAKKTGTASMFMDNYNYKGGNKHIDEMTTPPLNFSSVQNPSISFQVAYQLTTDPSKSPNFSDTLKVLISSDCGVTWTQLYKKYSTQLVTTTPQFANKEFVPTASQWRLETIPLTAYASADNVLIKFRHTCDYENNLYVDDINITGIIGVNELNLDNIVSIFPNPTDGNIFVNFSVFDLGNVNVKIYNVVGKVIADVTDNISVPKKIKINLSGQSNGFYFVEIRTENKSITKKLILNK
ncbi:MAG: T9SS type A sorting domain-containing protein [Bacteroidota bacterium]